MNKRYYFVSYRIELKNSTPVFAQELIEMTPLEYVIYCKNLGGDYSERIILFAQEINEAEYKKYASPINEE